MIADPQNAQRGTLTVASERFACALGRSGVTTTKREGDGATPIGVWPMRRILYRADRLSLPATVLPATPLTPDDGWCDSPGDDAYNRPVRHPYPASAERLWRDDGLYDVIVVLGYNDAPVVPGAGSAIFFHIARPDLTPTEGCVAVRLPDMLTILAKLASARTMTIAATACPVRA